MELNELSATELARELQVRHLSARDVVLHFLSRIERYDSDLGAFLQVTRERALEAADRVDALRREGATIGPLAGVPVAIKDNITVAGYPTTCGSRILEPYRPPFDATVVARLADSGLPMLGKTNLDEFGMGSSTERSAYRTASNPWDRARVPGGSSGGSAIAVASRLAPLALGSDTGGSVRQPASLCGIVGLKPTYGAVSRFGLIAYASSLDQIGPLARTVEDCATLYTLIAGRDPRDSTSVEVSTECLLDGLRQPLAGLRIGVVREMTREGIAAQTREAVDRAAGVLAGLGCAVDEASLPHMHYSIPTYYVLACAEASSNLARFDGVRYGLRAVPSSDVIEMFEKTRAIGLGPEVKRRVLLGAFVLSSGYYDAYYARAQKVRTLIKRDFEQAFSRFDLLIGACSPAPAFRKGEKTASPVEMYAADVCTVSVNLAGGPGLCIPCGFTSDALPIGLQIMGRAFDEARMLRLGHQYQECTDFHRRMPPS